MSKSNWKNINKWLDELLELGDSERAARLEELKANDPELYAEVSEFISAMDDSAGFLESDAFNFADHLIQDISDELNTDPKKQEYINRQVGPYRLKKQLGMGGMGMVYLAERVDGSFKRDVALKFIRSGMENDMLIQRFKNEQHILASLNHPNIAHLYDAGQDEHGVPYIIMEHVEGSSIPDYCEKNKLNLTDRVRLFLQVCEVVHFAHQNLIVHRDLKPSNIFVTEDGTVKLLDFGIAKLMEDSPQKPLTISRMGFLSMHYASPEQVNEEDISTASDIYSLGMVLYELLSGMLPFDTDSISSAELIQKISDGSIEKPSTRLKNASDTQLKVTYQSREKLIRSLAGDLDNIILKALAREPSRRYKSTLALQEDLQHYLDGQPVAARPATFTYRAGKFIQRNALPHVMLALLLFLAVGGVWYHISQLESERDYARQQAQRAERVAGFMTSIFEAANPAATSGEEFTASQVLIQGMESAEPLREEDPVMYAAFILEMGRAWEAFGNYEEALDAYQTSLDVRREVLEPGHPDIAKSMFHRADINHRYIPGETDAYDQFREVLDLQVAALGEWHADVAETYYNIGLYYGQQHNNPKAREYFQRTVDILSEIKEPDDMPLIEARGDLAFMMGMMGDYDEAFKIYDDVLERQQRLLPEFHNSTVHHYNSYAGLLSRAGRFEEALYYNEKSLEGYLHIYGEEHLFPSIVMMTLSSLYSNLERHEEALDLIDDAIEIMLMNVAPNHGYLHSAYLRRGDFLVELDRHEEAEEYFKKSLFIDRESERGQQHPRRVLPKRSLGELYISQGRYREAEELLEVANELFEIFPEPRVARQLEIRFALARSYFYQDKTVEASSLMAEIQDEFLDFYGDESEEYILLQQYLSELNGSGIKG